MVLNYEELMFMTDVAEKAERFDDMLKYIQEAINLNSNLSMKECTIFNIACKNVISS